MVLLNGRWKLLELLKRALVDLRFKGSEVL